MTHLKTKDAVPRRVLIVDDDTSIDVLWETVLRTMGIDMKVDWATSEVEASAMIASLLQQNLFYDLIVADIFLSGSGTGLDLWQKATLAQRERFVIVSSSNEKKIAEHLKSHTLMPNFLPKPLNLNDMRKVTDKIFNLGSITNAPMSMDPFV